MSTLKISRFRDAVGVLLLFTLPLWAQPGAVLQIVGPVNVNGRPTARTAVLFDADAIQTFSSPAAITQLGASVIIDANTRVAYSQRNIKLSSGSTTVVASVPFRVTAERVVVESTSARSKFSVRETPCFIQVAALEGGVSVNDGTRTVLLQSERTISLPLSKKSALVANDCVEGGGSTATAGSANSNGNVALWIGSSVGSALLVLGLTDRNQAPMSAGGP